MIVEAAAILRLAPLAAAALRQYRRRDTVKALDRLVRAEFERDDKLGPTVRDSLLTQWAYIHGDPGAAVIIEGLLAQGEPAWLEALSIRSTELLSGLETLPWDIDRTVDRIVGAVRNNYVAAQSSAESSTQRAATTILIKLEDLATSADVQAVNDRLVDFERQLEPRPPRVLLVFSSFDDDQRRHIAWLHERSEGGSNAIAQQLDSAGIDGLVATVRSPPQWTVEEGWAFWRAVGRILIDAGRIADAEAAFIREASCRDVLDRADALMAAAACAERGGRPQDADLHAAGAREIDATHPSVALFDATRAPTADARLALVDAIVPRTDGQAARRHANRALALLALGRYDEAAAAAEASTRLDPHGAGAEVAALTIILRAHDRLPIEASDDRPLMSAVQLQLALHRRALETGQTAIAGLAGARAALGAAILGDDGAAEELIARVEPLIGAPHSDETRMMLVEAALVLEDADRAAALLPEPDGSPESRILHATVAMLRGDDPRLPAAALDQLLSELEPGPRHTSVVAMRLMAAGRPEVTLDPDIADGIADGDRLVAQARAARALGEGDLQAARIALTAFDDSISLSMRVETAVRSGGLPEAVALQTALTRRNRSARNMLRLARLRAQAGDFAGAIRDALRLASDDRKLPRTRDSAYALAAQAALDSEDFDELIDIADRWGELSPDRQDPLWYAVYARVRQNRHKEALRAAVEFGLEPMDLGNRHLLFAELYMYGLPPRQRARALMDLSDRFGRPMELEQAFIGGVLLTPDAERDEDPVVVKRFQDAISTFEERFPGTATWTSIELTTDEGPDALVRRLAAAAPEDSSAGIEARQEALDGVRRGSVPIAFLAAMIGRSTAETIIRNGAHPMAVFDAETHSAELTAALSALDRAMASWDETACVTSARLSAEDAHLIRSALVDSRVGQAASDCIASAARSRFAGEHVATMHLRADGSPLIVEEDPAIVSLIRRVEADADLVAASLTVMPDSAASDPKLAGVIEDEQRKRAASPLGAVASAILCAKTSTAPLYSDDRAVRAYARGLDVPAFGSLALVDALQRRGVIDAQRAEVVITSLVDMGVWSLALRPDAYVAAARRAGFSLARSARSLLADEALLRVDARIPHNGLLLRAVAAEAPGQLHAWSSAILEAYAALLEADPFVVASLLVAEQFAPTGARDQEHPQRTTQVATALAAVGLFGSSVDAASLLVAGAGRWLHGVADTSQRDEILASLCRQVDDDGAAILDAAFRRPDESGAGA